MIKIAFTRSRSVQFNDALHFGKLLPGFVNDKGAYEVEMTNQQIFDNWENFSRFHNLVTRWAGCKVFHNEKLISPYNMQLFYALQEIYHCSRDVKHHNCRLSGNRAGWGCLKLNRIKRHVEYYSYVYWYQFGRFSPDFQNWQVNKKLLYEKLIIDIDTLHLGECPYFDKGKIMASINLLPDSIRIDKISWEIVYREDFVGDRVGRLPDGIRHIIREVDLNESDFDLFGAPDITPEKTIDEMTNDEINRLIEEKRKKM